MHFSALVKLRWLWVLDLTFRLSCLCFCGDANLSLKCLYFFLSLIMRICALIEIDVFFLCRDLKVLEVIHNLWLIIECIIVKNFLECILVLLREDGDEQPLILQTKLILKKNIEDSACPALSKTVWPSWCNRAADSYPVAI